MMEVGGLGGPYYEDLRHGQRFATAPGVTLTEGLAAWHLAVTGARLRLPLDEPLCRAVTGLGPAIAHPGLVIDLAIGQSTVVTQRVIANLFYRGLTLRRPPRIGDTLRTVVEVAALRDSRPTADRPPRGLAALHVVTVDQQDRVVLDFHRCAMLPMRGEEHRPGHNDDLAEVGEEIDVPAVAEPFAGWDLDAFRAALDPPPEPMPIGTCLRLETGDTVTAAPELARLTLNLAGAHHDPFARPEGRRLVYGGHTIGVAAGHLTRALPDVVYLVAWHSCDHLGPVFEGDVLRSAIAIEGSLPLRRGRLLSLRVITAAWREGARPVDVLDWRPVALAA
jgi:acyl dehydratase